MEFYFTWKVHPQLISPTRSNYSQWITFKKAVCLWHSVTDTTFFLSNESLVLSNDNRRLEKSRPIHSSSKFSLYRWQQTGPHLTLQNVDGCILLQEWEGRVQIKERERTHLILMWESGMLGIWHHKIRMPSAGEMGGEWQDERREWTWNGWQKE